VKPSKESEPDRSSKEAQELFERTVKRMLSTPPRPHEPHGKGARRDKPRAPHTGKH